MPRSTDRLSTPALPELAPLSRTEGNLIIDGDRITTCDPDTARLLGAGTVDVMARPLHEWLGGDRERSVWRERSAAARGGLPQSFLARFRRADDTLLQGLITLTHLGDNQFRADISELGSPRLIGAHAYLRQILDSINAVAYIKDREGRFLYINRHFEQLFGMSAESILGKRDRDFFPAERYAEYRRNDLQVLDRGAPMEFEESADLPDGRHCYISLKFPLTDRAGAAFAVCGVSVDISSRKRMELALRDAAFGLSSTPSEDLFTDLLLLLTRILQVDLAFIGVPSEKRPSAVSTIAFVLHGQRHRDIEYDLAGTACEHVIGKEFLFVPADLPRIYPNEDLLPVPVESYAAIPLFDSKERSLGLLTVMHSQPMRDRQLCELMLRIFAERIAPEIERRQSQDALRRSEEQYRTIFDASVDAIVVWSTDGHIKDANPAFCSMLGYERDEIFSLGPGSFKPEDAPEQYEQFVDIVGTGRQFHLDVRARRKDGSCLEADVIGVPIEFEGERHMLTILRDVTERKEREAAVQRSEERLRATIESALDCIIGMDAEGMIVEFNPVAEQMFGHRREDVLGRPLAELIIPERHRSAHLGGLARFNRTGKGKYLGRRIEIEAMRADGSEFPVELAITAVQNPAGNLFIGYMRDITERKTAERDRNRLQDQLRQAQKMQAIGHLSGGIAHDFNNILTSIMGYLVLAQEREKSLDDPRLAKYLERSLRSGKRAQELIQQLLTFSRGQRGERRAISLKPLLKESVQLIRSTLPSSIELRTQVNVDVPSVMLDPVHLEQIFLNLCINARDAMGGRGTLIVSLGQTHLDNDVCTACRASFSGDFVELAVGDTGNGVPADILDRIFEPFFSTKETGKGSGMGLAMVHGIVHEYGGHIVVETEPGHGTVFRVMLPAIEDARAAGAASDDNSASAGLAKVRLRGHVLVVDDEPDVAEFMAELFTTWGTEATVASSAVHAKAMLDRDPTGIDLVLTDQTMPGMTGLELAKYTRTLRPELPVILYTGYSENVDRDAAAAAGIRAFLRKPVDVAELAKIVRELLPEAAD